ncbi:BIRC7_8 [Mytilus edulis]|uniref:BIRC7_8 n=1 Tax=Mytilus edulis TaxID=6550 RepID=A0A8S3SEB3_MYTED|nr:BIRC7_8 [Mytilus edulis]
MCDDVKKTCDWVELYDLQNRGLLSDHLMNKLFSKVHKLLFGQCKTYILDVMEKFDIVIKPNSIDSYYMPCMITKVSSLEKIKKEFDVHQERCSPWLVVEFKFLPISYYNHILFMYIREKTVCKEKIPFGDGPPAIYAGKVIVYLDETKQRKLVICFSRNAISLQIWNNIDMDNKEYRKIIAEICNKITDLETKLDNELQYEIKSKCNTGDYFSSSGRISYEDLNTLCVGGEYYCEEHECEHKKDDIENTWLKTAALIHTNKRLESFNSWTSAKHAKATPKNLAAAGFFYSGTSDIVLKHCSKIS